MKTASKQLIWSNQATQDTIAWITDDERRFLLAREIARQHEDMLDAAIQLQEQLGGEICLTVYSKKQAMYTADAFNRFLANINWLEITEDLRQ